MIKKVVETPVGTVIDLLPQLLFFIYSGGLTQGLQQFVAPLTTLVDLVNEITAREVAINGGTYQALDIYGLITGFITGNETIGELVDTTEWEDLYDIIAGFTSKEALEGMLYKLLAKNIVLKDADGKPIEVNGKTQPDTEKITQIYTTIGARADGTGLFAALLGKIGTVDYLATARCCEAMGAKPTGEEKDTYYHTDYKYVGIKANRADTIMALLGDLLLGGETSLLEVILDIAGVKVEGTVAEILDKVTGENRYVIIQVLLAYFFHYEVESLNMEYLSFDKVDYEYEDFKTDTKLTQRKLRRSIKKLDGTILTLVPELMPLLEENETFKAILKNFSDTSNITIKDIVDQLLVDYAINDDMMNTILGLIIGLLGGEDLASTLNTVLPLVDTLVGYDLTPAGFAEAATGDVKTFLTAAITATGKAAEEVTWSDIAAPYLQYVYTATLLDDESHPVLDEDDKPVTITYTSTEANLASTTVNLNSKGKIAAADEEYNTYALSDVYVTKTEKDEVTEEETKLYKYTYTKGEGEEQTTEVYWGDSDNLTTATIDGTEYTVTIVREMKVVLTEEWGIDAAATTEAKINAFIDVLGGALNPVLGILDFLLRGKDINILPSVENGVETGVLTLKGGEGYKALYELFRGLAANDLVAWDTVKNYTNATAVLNAIVKPVLSIVEQLENGPVEYILTLLPTLSYFIASDGVEYVVKQLLAPAFALLDIVNPVLGPLIDDLITKYLGEYLEILNPNGGEVVKDEDDNPVVDEEGKPVKRYSIDDIFGIIGENGKNLVNLLNRILSGVLLKASDENAEFSFDTLNEIEVFQILPETFFTDYAAHSIIINKKTASSKVYYFLSNGVKVAQDAYNMNAEAYGNATITDTRYVVDLFKVDIADSLVYLLDSVLSEALLSQVKTLLEAKGVIEGNDNIIGGILDGIINSENNGLKLAEVITALFEGYDVVYAEWINRYIEVDHSDYDDLSSQELKDQVAVIPSKLDNVLNNAIPVLKNLLPGLITENGTKPVSETVQSILDALGDSTNLESLIKNILSTLLINDELMSTIFDLLVGLLAGLDPSLIDTINKVLPILAIDMDLTPAGIKAIATTSGITGLLEYLGDVDEDTTWADVAAQYIKYGYTYVVPGEGDADDKTVEYYGGANETEITIGEGDDAATYPLTKLYVTKTEKNEETGVETKLYKYTYEITKDGKTETKEYWNESSILTTATIEGEPYDVTIVRATKVDSKDANVVWGVSELQDIVSILGPILDPFSILLNVILQGRTLTLINNGGEYKLVNTNEYTANDNGGIDTTVVQDPGQDGTEIGNGYIEIRGSNGYEQALVPLLEALGLRTDSATGALLTQAQFNTKTTATQMLSYLVAEIEAILSNLESKPVGFLANNLASVIYFIANDGVSTLIDSALAFVNALLAVVEDFYEVKLEDFVDLFYTVKIDDTHTGKVDPETHEEIVKKGLISTINDLLKDALEENGATFTLTRDMLYTLAGKLGEFETYISARSTAMSYLVTTDNQYVDANGEPIEGVAGSVTSLVGKEKYFLSGLVGFVLGTPEIVELIEDLLPGPDDQGKPNQITEIVTGLLNDPDGVEGILKILAKLFNKYVVTYLAIEQPDAANELEKVAIPYYDETEGADNTDNRTVTKDQTTAAITTLDALISEILPLFIEDFTSLSDFIGDFLYNDELVTKLLDLIVEALGGLDEKTMSTIEMVLGIVKDVLGDEYDIQLTPAAFLANEPRLEAYFGEATTWSEIAAQYIKYGYTYVVPGEGGAQDKTVEYYDYDADKATVIIGEGADAVTYTLTKLYDDEKTEPVTRLNADNQTEYKYTYVDGEETKTYWSTEAGLKKATIGGVEYNLTAVTTPVRKTKVDSADKLFAEDSTYSLGITDADTLISFVCNLLKPADPILKVILGGGVYEFDETKPETDPAKYGKAISAFEEINIMGGSGYNYAIIPLLEMFGITTVNGQPLKTQAEYNTLIENESPLKYVLTAILSILDENNLNAPVSFILGKLANIAYYISQNGLTKIVANLIAPVSEIIRSIEGILPIAIIIDIPAALDDDDETDIFAFKMGSDVTAEMEVGLTIDLDGATLEGLINTLLEKYLPEFSIPISFATLAGQCAEATGETITYTDSKVDPKWDIVKWSRSGAEWIKNLTGSPADTLIALIELIVNTDNIQALLDKIEYSPEKLPEKIRDELSAIIDRLVADPDPIVDAIIKLLAGGGYSVETIEMAFKYLGTLEYDYDEDGDGWHALSPFGREYKVNEAISKLDKILLRAVPKVIDLLAEQTEPIELITKIKEGLGDQEATIENIVNYFLNGYVFKDDLVNTIMTALVGALGGMDDSTFTLIMNVLDKVTVKKGDGPAKKIDLSLAGIKTASGEDGKLTGFIGDATSWAALAAQYKKYVYVATIDGKEVEKYDATEQASIERDGVTYTLKKDADDNAVTKAVVDYTWNISDKDSFMAVIDELLTVVNPVLEWFLNGSDIQLFVETLKIKGGNTYSGAIVPLAKVLGIAIDDDASTGVAMVDSLIDGIFGLVEDIEEAPVSTILEVLGNLSYLVANDGVAGHAVSVHQLTGDQSKSEDDAQCRGAAHLPLD